MDFKNIDSLFDQAFRRIDAKMGVSSPYNEPPLASDHFLLRRSWEYFQQRANALENEWRQIAKAKDDEIKALRELIRLRDARLLELEEGHTDLEKVQESFARARLDEQMKFSDATKNLHDTWENEREALIRAVDEANGIVQRVRAEAEQRLKSAHAEASSLRAAVEKLRVDLAAQSEKRVASDGEALQALADRDDVVRSLESKVDLMRSELASRDLALKAAETNAADAGNSVDVLLKKAAVDQASLGAKDEEIRFLGEKLEAARREIESLRSGWTREQAEWRELWDRSREMWERKK